MTFDNVRVPVDQRVCDEHQGWTAAKYILGNECSDTTEVSRTWSNLDRLKRLTARVHEGGGRIDAERDFAANVAKVKAALRALELTEMRFFFGPGGPDIMGAEASMPKIRGTELQQRASELTVESLGHYATRRSPNKRSRATTVPTSAPGRRPMRRAATSACGPLRSIPAPKRSSVTSSPRRCSDCRPASCISSPRECAFAA